MRAALTGTPGTGKTTVADLVETDLEVVNLNDVVREEGLTASRDEKRDSLVLDMDATRAWLDGRDDVLVESHLAHRFEVDRVVVLRCHPEALTTRLTERGEREAKARENAEAEALDVVLGEAVAEYGADRVYEIDTTDRSPEAVARDVAAALSGDRSPSAGDVDFTRWLA
jgi:adenylate kinase